MGRLTDRVGRGFRFRQPFNDRLNRTWLRLRLKKGYERVSQQDFVADALTFALDEMAQGRWKPKKVS